jgi:hypothetical protein
MKVKVLVCLNVLVVAGGVKAGGQTPAKPALWHVQMSPVALSVA